MTEWDWPIYWITDRIKDWTNEIIVSLMVLATVKIYALVQKREPNFSSSFEKVKKEIKKLDKLLRNKKFAPDLILGITGEEGLIGGCIVGAWLASPPLLNRSKGFYPTFRDKELSEALKKIITQNGYKNILLVDDESRSGETIKKEFDELQKYFPDTNIKVAVIIVRKESWENHRSFWNNHIFCYSNVPDKEVNWPWEVVVKK